MVSSAAPPRLPAVACNGATATPPMPRLRLAALVLASALPVALAACDFTPALDIDVPEHEARAVIRAVLAADSVAVVRVGMSEDPYGARRTYNRFDATPAARVTLLREGGVVEVLAVRSLRCEDFSREGTPTYECGPYAGTVPVEAGATYTVRVEMDGLPTAEGTVTVPPRPTVTAEEVTAEGEPTGLPEPRRFRVRIADAPGRGDRYGFGVVRSFESYTTVSATCDKAGVCRDSVTVGTAPYRVALSFRTNDPVLLAATRQVPGDAVELATFTDQTFDGAAFSFEVEIDDFYYGDYDDGAFAVDYGPLTVQVAAFSTEVYDAYQISAFSLGDDNPFAEPANLPSNVEGGYGLVGAVALAEVVFPERGGAGAR